MGFFLSFLIEVNFGLDPCTFLNLTISERTAASFGSCQLAMNCLLFIPVLLFGRDLVGWGTIANMVLIGYISDFCRWCWARILPSDFFAGSARVPVFIISLLLFVFAASLYMNADMGVSPYDAIPVMIGRCIPKCSFRFVRMGFDFLVILIGVLLGGTPTVGNILMALLLGPVITMVGKQLSKTLLRESRESLAA